MRNSGFLILLLSLAWALSLFVACERHEMEVDPPTAGRSLTRAETRAVQEVADATAREVRVLLPNLPKRLRLRVELDKNVIPETGENGTAVQPAEIVWSVDPERDFLGVVRAQLRLTLFHELHHLAREAVIPRKSLMDAVVTEGLATAFERDFGHTTPPWGAPPPPSSQVDGGGTNDWVHELLAQPADAPRDQWLIRHSDGRRWIGMRAGTSLVDRATKSSGQTSATLVVTPTDEVLRLAGVR